MTKYKNNITKVKCNLYKWKTGHVPYTNIFIGRKFREENKDNWGKRKQKQKKKHKYLPE